MASNYARVQALLEHRTIEDLHIGAAKMRNEGVTALGDCLRQSSRLTTIRLWDNEIGDSVTAPRRP